MSPKQESIVWIIMILICVGLTAKLVLEAKEYSCSKCSIEFDTRLPYANLTIVYKTEVYVDDLFSEWLQGRCMVLWSETQGFIIKENLILD